MSNPTQLRRAVASSFLGSVIEYYDFLLYATASALVFGKVFFSNLSPLAATVASLGTFATGYLARPLGGVIFGHFGDRLGRKRMLVLTMTLMGVASTLIGVLPTYEQLGVLAPIALVLLRVVQGIAVGGEWGGAVLMSAEHASGRRGLWASFTNAGAPFGMLLSTAALNGSAALMDEQAFLSWGWRIPFLLSIVLLGIGLFVRSRVEETPVFASAASSSPGPRSAPLLDVLRNHPKALLLGIGVGLSPFVLQGTLTTFLVSYGVQAGFARQQVLNGLTLTSGLAVVGIIGWSALSDRVGRRPIVLAGAVAAAAYAFVIFPLADSGSVGLLTLALVLGQSIIHPMMYGPLAALYAELFATRSRYTGASLGYQIAGLGAGLAPLLFAQIQASTGGGGTGLISAVIAGFCLLTVVCTAALRETSRTDLGSAADLSVTR
ncbi:MFS transporter [Nonomuraea gerenzanensis]|uniref:Permease of the major facilitator superfamily n=1 Tax=Nonomuraea gerenzanensis TaxID=93944 RepID=A0A1M4E5F5_9ACTN|nr:MFS transporter [Nonomuraea gerenzanensis]UBU16191.1 MHS family MFS transporter [Nonomuraea gerenzanensis]SBO94002.1 permease of the major facilitator superfamily [Nonomuraea gerenzanensis]